MHTIQIRFGEDPGRPESDPRRIIDEMFNLVNPRYNACHRIWRPQMDIYESPGEIILVVEIAGAKREDLHVEIGRKTVKISGRRRIRPLSEDARYRLVEIPYGYFERSLVLPAPIDADQVDATYIDGLLQIRMAKLPLEKIRKIYVQNG
ncbi:MAG: heat-shock protein Hsp20 [Deltaproteobacteria bacterium HGW-Deltaproteobacteria-11]|nr:MAG: heat-shock protein Hsp20 [Deltaproteobacteria bacterium HGW-Deltaproteobacteria-11]